MDGPFNHGSARPRIYTAARPAGQGTRGTDSQQPALCATLFRKRLTRVTSTCSVLPSLLFIFVKSQVPQDSTEFTGSSLSPPLAKLHAPRSPSAVKKLLMKLLEHQKVDGPTTTSTPWTLILHLTFIFHLKLSAGPWS